MERTNKKNLLIAIPFITIYMIALAILIPIFT